MFFVCIRSTACGFLSIILCTYTYIDHQCTLKHRNCKIYFQVVKIVLLMVYSLPTTSARYVLLLFRRSCSIITMQFVKLMRYVGKRIPPCRPVDVDRATSNARLNNNCLIYISSEKSFQDQAFNLHIINYMS